MLPILTLDTANIIAAWAYPAGIALAIIFPLFRIASRAAYNIRPYRTDENVMHDIFGGLAIPQFIVLIMYPMAPEGYDVDPQFFAVAGLYGMYIICADLIDHGRDPSLRERESDKQNKLQEPT